jgi:hypothetical protein
VKNIEVVEGKGGERWSRRLIGRQKATHVSMCHFREAVIAFDQNAAMSPEVARRYKTSSNFSRTIGSGGFTRW